MPFFVDCYTGNDAASGASWATAWRTLDKVAAHGPADVYHIAPGFYRLEIPKSVTNKWWCALIGYGGVVVDSVGAEAGFPITYYSDHIYQNIVFKENTLQFSGQDAPNDYRAVARLLNCDLHNNSIVIPKQGTMRIVLDIINCTCQGELPPAGALESSFGPFKVLTNPLILQANEYTLSNNALNKLASGQCFLLNDEFPLGAACIRPTASQFDAGGTSFVPGFEAPLGISRRFDIHPPYVAQKHFTSWAYDPTGPVGAVTISDNYGITLAEGDGVRCVSPVLEYSRGVSVSRVQLQAQEFAVGGYNQVIDSTPADATRTVEFRISDFPFTQFDALPAWNTVERNIDLTPTSGRYVQFRVTFNLAAT
jgi:hypothetical protein